MRAARTALRLPALPQLRTKEPKRKTVSGRQPDCAVWLGAAFLAGYLPGIWLGRDGTTALGQQLAAWYTESPESTAFTAAFGTRFAVGALQLCAVLLCGFCIWGVGLLVLFRTNRPLKDNLAILVLLLLVGIAVGGVLTLLGVVL